MSVSSLFLNRLVAKQSFSSDSLKTPCYVIDQSRLLSACDSLITLRQVGCTPLYSIKSLPFVPVLNSINSYVDGFSVSSLFEAKLARQVCGSKGKISLTTPGIREDELSDLTALCDHVVLNSLTQYERYSQLLAAECSLGLRVNPELSIVSDARFDPCRPHSKLGVSLSQLETISTSQLRLLSGLHVHHVFGQVDLGTLIRLLEHLSGKLPRLLTQLSWINLGGGYLIEKINDYSLLAQAVNEVKQQFGVEVLIEPGKGVVDSAVSLRARVIDLFESGGKNIAVLDTSINHHPEVFEYQRQPELRECDQEGKFSAILAGSSCLAGDLFGEYNFANPLSIGDMLCFPSVGAYTLVKANRFNGINLPSIYWLSRDNALSCLKQYDYESYYALWSADA